MDSTKIKEELNKLNYFKNNSLQSVSHCLKDFDSDEINDEEKSCLQNFSKKVHLIAYPSQIDYYAAYGRPPQEA